MVNRKTFLSPTETSHYAKKKNPQTSKLFICMLDWMHPLTRKNNSTIMTTNPSFSFFVFLINNTHCQEKCHRFCDLSPRVYEQSYCSWYKTTGIIKPSFYVMVAILANKNLFSLHRFFSAKFIKFHNTAVLMSSTWWHHNLSWQSLSVLNQPFYLTIFFKAIEDYLCQKNMIVGCVSL